MSSPSYIGRYEVRQEIAQGGFATVLKGWDEELESYVALKIIHTDLSEIEELQVRFLEEARLLRRIRSPNVITVHDVGRLGDGRPYLVMDYADGKTLSDRLDRFKGRPVDTRSLSILVDALADGLSAIHEAGVVHRDIKPANILLQSVRWASSNNSDEGTELSSNAAFIHPGERVVIGDLGIAKDLVKDSGKFTIVGGSPLFQPPEQIDANVNVTPAADIYASTALLFQCLAGCPPPPAHAITERLMDLPEGWREVIAQGMAIDPQDRFASMENWRSAVQDVLAAQAAVAQEDAATTALIVSTDCPYKGLAAYQPEDAENFFGRERLIDELVRRSKIERVLVVGGPSGSGKSSLVRAGLLPALKTGGLPGSDQGPIILMTPGRDPLAELYDQIVGLRGDDFPSVTLKDVLEQPSLARRLGRTKAGNSPMVIFIDQFEELFTLAPEEQQSRFVDALSALTDPADSQVKLIIAIRADFYDTCARLPWLAERISENQVLVGPMTDSELRRAINEPARKSGYYLERNLVEAIIDETQNEIGSLPLIAHALVETWIRRKGNTLTLDGFRAAGGVAGAISQTADDTYKNRFNDQQQLACRRLFLRLVASREGGLDTRRIASRADLEKDSEPEILAQVVETLTEVRLLTVDQSTVQIAHEALLRTWPRLRGWIEESRDDLRFRQRITRAADEWEIESRNPDLLYRGTPLLSARDWVDKNPDQLDQLEREYLDASIEAKVLSDSVAADRQRKSMRLKRIAISALAVLAIGATGASIIAFMAFQASVKNETLAQNATQEARESFGRSLGAVAKGLARDDPLLALALASEAMARTKVGAFGFDARSAMVEARGMLVEKGPFLLGNSIAAGDAISIAMNVAGSEVATGLRDGRIRIFDLQQGGQTKFEFMGHGGGVESLDFSSDGKQLASASADGTFKIWDISGNGEPRPTTVEKSNDILWSVKFSPENNLVATAGEDGTVQLWSAGNATPIGKPLLQRNGNFSTVLFGTATAGLIVGNGKGEVFGLSLPGGEQMFEPLRNAHTSDIWEMDISPDGRTVATSSSDGTSALIDFATGKVLGHAFKSGAKVSESAFSRDGKMLIGGNSKGNLLLWEIDKERITGTSVVGHSQPIVAMKINGRGNRIVSLGADQQIRQWSYGEPRPLYRQYGQKGSKTKAVSVSPDGQYLAVGSEKGAVSVWRLDVRTAAKKFDAHTSGVWAAAFSSDSSRVLTGDRDGKIIMWSVDNGATELVVPGQGKSIWSLGYMPGGKSFFAAQDEKVVIRDAVTGEVQREFKSTGGRITHADLSLDGSVLAVATTMGNLAVWDVASGGFIRELKVEDDVVWSVSFSPDSSLVAAATSDEVVAVFDVKSGSKIIELTGHAGGAMDIAYLSGGATLAVVDRKGQLHLWDTKTGRRLGDPIQAHAGASWRISPHPDGVRFITSGDDGAAKLWTIFSMPETCSITRAAFGVERQKQYLGEQEKPIACTAEHH